MYDGEPVELRVFGINIKWTKLYDLCVDLNGVQAVCIRSTEIFGVCSSNLADGVILCGWRLDHSRVEYVYTELVNNTNSEIKVNVNKWIYMYI